MTQPASIVERIVAKVDARLRADGHPRRAVAEKKYLKSDLAFYGTDLPTMRRLVAETIREHPTLAESDWIAVLDDLWSEPVHERRAVAALLLERLIATLTADDLALVERFIRESKTWAYVDLLASHVAGPLVERFPRLKRTLDRWSNDDDFWIRRSALLALLLPLRRGAGDFARFGRFADRMLDEREFFIRKAIGWLLRETSKKRPTLVYEWLAPRASRASGVTMR